MRHRFDDKYIASLKPAAKGKRYDVYDDMFSPGLLLVRVTEHSKSFMIRARAPVRL